MKTDTQDILVSYRNWESSQSVDVEFINNSTYHEERRFSITVKAITGRNEIVDEGGEKKSILHFFTSHLFLESRMASYRLSFSRWCCPGTSP